MSVPGTQEIRKPLLEAFKGEAPRNFVTNEILELMAENFGLNLNELSSGDKNLLRSRVNEAKSDLKKNNLLCNPSGYTYMITNAGTEVLEDNPAVISDDYLAGRKG
ncbi:MAG: winged helix-turn-helix domain-containing protein, partial [Synergistaceae bacterium]|nr:winged helix-turn-helix domain-containing protein [Synergistaceae bacterium]